MPWMPENDAELVRLFQQGFCAAFIANCLRVTSGEVRLRLTELGLKKPPRKPGRPRKTPLHAPASQPPAAARAHLAALPSPSPDDAEETDFSQRRGRPRGHLLSEAEIAARYRQAGRNYAGEFGRAG